MPQNATTLSSEEPRETAVARALHDTGALLSFISANSSAELFADDIHGVAVVRWLDRTVNDSFHATLISLRVLLQDLATRTLLHDGRLAPITSGQSAFVEGVTQEILLRNLVSDWVIVHPTVLPTDIHHQFAMSCLESGTALHTVTTATRAYQRIARLTSNTRTPKASQLAEEQFEFLEGNYAAALYVNVETQTVLLALTGYNDPHQLQAMYKLVRRLALTYKSLICDCRNVAAPSLHMAVGYALNELPILFGPRKFDRFVHVHYDESAFEQLGIDIEGYVEIHGKVYSSVTAWPEAFELTRTVYAATRGATTG